MNTKSISPLEVIAAVNKYGQVLAIGGIALQAVHGALRLLSESNRLKLTFQPGTDPSLQDYLASAVTRAVQGSALAGLVGLVLGLIAGRPVQGLAIGVSVGAIAGAVDGVHRVGIGWRIAATWQADGQARVLVSAAA
jgi:hypothetical protein